MIRGHSWGDRPYGLRIDTRGGGSDPARRDRGTSFRGARALP
jgi:hypothetical protein